MKKNDYKCPEIENMKKLTDELFEKTKDFIEKYKENRGER